MKMAKESHRRRSQSRGRHDRRRSQSRGRCDRRRSQSRGRCDGSLPPGYKTKKCTTANCNDCFFLHEGEEKFDTAPEISILCRKGSDCIVDGCRFIHPSSEEKPSANEPSEEKLPEDKLSEEKSSANESSEKKPSSNESSEKKPSKKKNTLKKGSGSSVSTESVIISFKEKE